MKNSRTFAFAVAAVVLCAAASLAAPQDPPPASTPPPPPSTPPSRPPLVDAHSPRLPQTTKVKLDKYKGRVLVFNIATIVVQSMENQRMVWSFQYSTDLHSKVADMLSGGGYQPGDKVEVYCKPGTTVAVKLKGKPSKSI